MTSPKWIWGLAIGALAAAGLSMLLVKKEPPAPDKQPPRLTATAAPAATFESSPTPLMMAAAAPTNPPAEPTNTPAVGIALPDIVATPTLSPEDAEKLKEVAMYRNEEFGFEFQYPKYRRSSDDGRLIEVHEYRHNGGLDLMPLELTVMGVELAAIKKPADFSTLRSYIDEKNRRIEQRAKEDGDPLCFDEQMRSIQVANQEAFLEECVSSGHPESTIYIEDNEFVYHLFFLGHLNEPSHDPDIQQGLQFIRILLETWAFSEEGHE